MGAYENWPATSQACALFLNKLLVRTNCLRLSMVMAGNKGISKVLTVAGLDYKLCQGFVE